MIKPKTQVRTSMNRCSKAVEQTNPDPVTARLAWRLDQIMAKSASEQSEEDRELLEIVTSNQPSTMTESTFSRMYELLFGRDV